MPGLVVFGARNLGRELAATYARKGWGVAAVARSEETVEALREAVPDALGIAADAADQEAVERAFEEARQRFGGLDLVVNAITPSAHGGTGGGTRAGSRREALEPYVDEFLPAVFNVLSAGGRALTENGGGTFVQVTGGSARRGMPGRGPWAAAAFATRALVQSAAQELREQGVHVALLIVDATIDSPKTAAMLEGRSPDSSASQEEIVQAIEYLASQSPRAWTHELQLTPRGDRWVP
jgi:NAD(P)-dependent dehydrogenase (short-subunit alcohol dehydrogenase family)